MMNELMSQGMCIHGCVCDYIAYLIVARKPSYVATGEYYVSN